VGGFVRRLRAPSFGNRERKGGKLKRMCHVEKLYARRRENCVQRGKSHRKRQYETSTPNGTARVPPSQIESVNTPRTHARSVVSGRGSKDKKSVSPINAREEEETNSSSGGEHTVSEVSYRFYAKRKKNDRKKGNPKRSELGDRGRMGPWNGMGCEK